MPIHASNKHTLKVLDHFIYIWAGNVQHNPDPRHYFMRYPILSVRGGQVIQKLSKKEQDLLLSGFTIVAKVLPL